MDGKRLQLLIFVSAVSFAMLAGVTRSAIGARNLFDGGLPVPSSGLLEWVGAQNVNQWVQTGYKMTETMGYEVVFETESIGKTYQFYVCGGYAWSGSNAYPMYQWANSGRVLTIYPYAKNARVTVGLGNETPQRVHVCYDPAEGYFVNDSLAWAGPIVGVTGTRLPYMALFGYGGENLSSITPSSQGYASGGMQKICYFRMWDNGADIMRLLPYMLEDGTACFYDEVSGEFIGSAGSEELVAGPLKR